VARLPTAGDGIVKAAMEIKHRALIAAQPAAWTVLQSMLEEVMDLVPVHTMADALHVLQHDRGKIDLIICTLTFSESRMLEFLLAVKGNATISDIPFLCCRVLVGRLSEKLVERMGAVAKQCGADFINLAKFPRHEAKSVLRAAVMKCLKSNKRATT
jgi:PleD family two-component response regulator